MATDSDLGPRDSDFGPREVSKLLEISTSTLRTYAVKFDRLLSTSARGGALGEGAGFSHRRYAAADLQLLRQAKSLLDAGLSYEATLLQLGDGRILGRHLPAAGGSRHGRRASGRRAVSSAPAARSDAGLRTEADSLSVPPPVLVAESAVTAPGAGTDSPVAAAPTGSASSDRGPEVVELVRAAVDEAIFPLREEIKELRAGYHALADEVRARQRLLEEVRVQLARVQRRLDEVAAALDRPLPERRSWFGRLFRRSPNR